MKNLSRYLIIALLLLHAALCRAQETASCPRLKITDFPKEDLPPAGFNTDGLKVKYSSADY